MAHRKKVVAFVMAAVVVSSALAVHPVQSPAAEPNKTPAHSYLLSENDSNYQGSDIDTWELFLKMMAAVLIVVALGIAAIYVSKKYLPKITNVPGRRIHVVETVSLGPRKALHLLQIGHQQLLIGSTSEGITALADVTDALTRLSSEEAEDNK
ncbi:MAG: FliO/MopB family protein [Planctomycetota bacterium]